MSDDRKAKKAARRKIVQAANRHILKASVRRPFPARLLGDRQVQQAVKVVRHHRLVKNDVLAAAGFRPHGGES